MPLYIIGLGLGDERDITVKGADAIRKCDRVFLESYTSVLAVPAERLEEMYGKKVEIAYRETVESEAEKILEPAKTGSVAFLVVGDPFGATTHTDLLIRAQELGIETHIVHNASIMNAAGCCGLQLYSFGQTVSIPYFTETWRPDSFYPKIVYNAGGGMHTLCLLDIKVREPNLEALMQGRTKWDPPRFMSANEAIEQLLEIEGKHGKGACKPDSLAIVLARVGQDTQKLGAGTLAELVQVDFGGPLHSMVLCGEMHDLEKALFDRMRVDLSKEKKWVNPKKPTPKTADGDDDGTGEGLAATGGDGTSA